MSESSPVHLHAQLCKIALNVLRDGVVNSMVGNREELKMIIERAPSNEAASYMPCVVIKNLLQKREDQPVRFLHR